MNGNQRIIQAISDYLAPIDVRIVEGYSQLEAVNGSGMVGVFLPAAAPLSPEQPQLPEYRQRVEIVAQTYADDDPGRERINALYSAVKNKIMAAAPVDFFPECVAVIPGESSRQGTADTHQFVIALQLILQDFEY